MTPAPAERLDKWLWFARFCKTRSQAQGLIERGLVAIGGRAATKTSAAVRIGDEIRIVVGPLARTVIVRDLGGRRGPAAEARALYTEPGPAERLIAGAI